MTFPVGNLISNPSTAIDGQLGAGFGTLPKKQNTFLELLKGNEAFPRSAQGLMAAPIGLPMERGLYTQSNVASRFPRGTIGRGTNANQIASPEEQATRSTGGYLPSLAQPQFGQVGSGTSDFNATQRLMYETGKTLNQVLNGRTNAIYPAYNNSITNPKVQPNPFMTQAMLPKPTPDARAEESRFTGSNQPQNALLNNIAYRIAIGDETVTQSEQESIGRILSQAQSTTSNVPQGTRTVDKAGNPFNALDKYQATDIYGDPVIQEGTKKWVRGSDGIVRRAVARGGKFRVQKNRGGMSGGSAPVSPTPSSPTLPSSIGVVNLNLASG